MTRPRAHEEVVKDDATWTRPQRVRVARLFRHHVQRPGNPRGRIVRLPCTFWHGFRRGPHFVVPQPADCLGEPAAAHHVDYAHPFRVVWLCTNCHMAVHARRLRVVPSMICDYTSLVANVLQPQQARRRPEPPLEPPPF